ncbi:hypothetical protein C0J52_17565 [Blattella germanica]|nr:hypothetical protein C0J52_17565 [Blattella germanica]
MRSLEKETRRSCNCCSVDHITSNHDHSFDFNAVQQINMKKKLMMRKHKILAIPKLYQTQSSPVHGLAGQAVIKNGSLKLFNLKKCYD